MAATGEDDTPLEQRRTGQTPPGPGARPRARSVEGERPVARMHPSGRRLILPSLLVIAACGAAGFFTGSFDEAWQNIAVPVASALVVIGLGLVPFIRWASRVCLITTRRTVVRTGVFTRVRREILHNRSNTLSLRQGPLQTLFGSGDVTIANGAGQQLLLRDVPRARLVRAALQDLAETASIVPPSTRASESQRRSFDP